MDPLGLGVQGADLCLPKKGWSKIVQRRSVRQGRLRVVSGKYRGGLYFSCGASRTMG